MATTKTSKDLISNADSDASFFRSLEKRGIYLNEPQIQAVRHFKGPLLTLAGAGSGKTSVLVCRTGYLIAVRNVDPRNILLVTFSRKAAEEMRERIARLPGLNDTIAETIQARTFHSFFLQIIRKHGVTQDILNETRYQHILLKRARNEFILNFDKVFPTAKTITLDINYRSTSNIVGLGNEIIRHNARRKKKTLNPSSTVTR
jgi:DNA helicase-2/ATP-dependent DNA helicase PcrA